MGYRENIRARMDELGWNQTALSIASGVDPATLSRFFKETQGLNVVQLENVAQAMALKAGDLLERSDVDPMAERLTPVIARLRPLRLEDQIRAVGALALTLDAMLGWRDVGHETEVLRAAYNSRPSNSKKTDELAEPMGDYGSSAETANVPTSGGAAPTATAKNRGKSKR